MQRVAAGFRPVIPLLRGGAKPMIVAEDAAPLQETALNFPNAENLVDSDKGLTLRLKLMGLRMRPTFQLFRQNLLTACSS